MAAFAFFFGAVPASRVISAPAARRGAGIFHDGNGKHVSTVSFLLVCSVSVPRLQKSAAQRTHLLQVRKSAGLGFTNMTLVMTALVGVWVLTGSGGILPFRWCPVGGSLRKGINMITGNRWRSNISSGCRHHYRREQRENVHRLAIVKRTLRSGVGWDYAMLIANYVLILTLLLPFNFMDSNVTIMMFYTSRLREAAEFVNRSQW